MAGYRSYKFTDKHHSAGGIRSSIAAAVSFVCTLVCILSAYAAKGEGARYLVIFGTLAIVCCCYGLFAGNKSFKEEDCYYLFSKLGTAVNLVLVIFWIAVVGIGILV